MPEHSDLGERMGSALDGVRAPDSWAEAKRRAAAGSVRSPDRGPTSARQRLVAGGVALVVFVAGGAFAFAAFRPRPTPPAAPGEPTPVEVSTKTFDVGLRFLEGVVLESGSVWVAGSDGGWNDQLVRLDANTGAVQARIDVAVPGWEFGGGGLATGLGSVWILASSDKGDDRGGVWLYRIDPATNEVADSVQVSDSDNPEDLWVDETGIWVLSSSGDGHERITRLDPTNYKATMPTMTLPSTWSNTIVSAGSNVWVSGNTDDKNGAPPETLFKLDISGDLVATDEGKVTLSESQPADGDAFVLVPSGNRLWFEHNGLRALDATTGAEVVGPLALPGFLAEPTPGGCCSEVTSDGTGGVWAMGTTTDGEPRGLWHVDQNGVVLEESEASLGNEAAGNASAFDPATHSLWVIHYERTVSQLRIGPSTSSSDVASNALSPAPEPLDRWAYNGSCNVGLIRASRVEPDDLSRVLGPYMPQWLPPGFGLMMGYDGPGPQGGIANGPGAIWTDDHCRHVQLEFLPGVAKDESPRPAGQWELLGTENCTFAPLRDVHCVIYHAQDNEGVLNLTTVGISDEDAARIAAGIPLTS
jgi:hypothetical protein